MSLSSFKIVVLGSSGVGKTSTLQRYIRNSYNEQQISSIGVDWFYKNVFVYDGPKQAEVQLMLWDTSGYERFRSLALSYCKNASVVLLMFDLQDEHSLEQLHFWQQQALYAQHDVVFVLVGNKSDRMAQIQPSAIDRQKMDLKCLYYYEVSAMNGSGINEMFGAVAQLAFELKSQQTQPAVIKEQPQMQRRNLGCC